ncbi:MAG TPA: YolD-like family protein [Planococcus sp. (in: firmicutes)]|nr:YolD-like family protein [Planococcus sp. (in: firmicutes)]
MKINRDMKVIGEIKDRGRIKWTAMMLPEHIQMLRELQKEDRYKTKPILDEFDLEMIQEEIQLAFKRQCNVEIRTWENGRQSSTGTIIEIDLTSQILLLDTGIQTKRIAFSIIVGVKVIE